MKRSVWRDFTIGIIEENPLFSLVIGLCAALAVSSKVENAIFMGVAASFVLVSSNILISVIRKIVPSQIRIPVFIVVIASFVTIVDLSMKAFFPAGYEALGVWVPLIVVNCIILGRAEAFASKNGIIRSIADGLGKGFGYTLALLIIAVIRELGGTGQIVAFENTIVSLKGFQPPQILQSFPGAFFTFGILMGLLRKIQGKGE
ncbi:electron transport complex subunit RsxE [Candidatus Oleimmundimicrobium sp.]|uniref:electron transport complex subunit RsxE n=1 Tax=Candidatus Oleimmundimicrobium sp. TaxID=3060597 RepID=UPI002721EC15|nr:electron transport complex subunit RsxE [Candidatus Oleimmundimicrobium sp.]MDO8886132.1 electron transport complex subunit RsxE [Candidatus Oleimmundimicrobium sp.]